MAQRQLRQIKYLNRELSFTVPPGLGWGTPQHAPARAGRPSYPVGLYSGPPSAPRGRPGGAGAGVRTACITARKESSFVFSSIRLGVISRLFTHAREAHKRDELPPSEEPLYVSPELAQMIVAHSAFVKQLTTPSRDRRFVAVALSWVGGGSSVFLSFTNWTERVPMVLAQGNTHVVTVHLCAGEHQYLFEVDGVPCIADEEPMVSVDRLIVNSVVVDDGSEYEKLGGQAARSESATQIDDDGMAPSWSARADADGFSTTVPTNLKVAWDEPPPLPAALARVHGVPQTATSRHICRIIWPEGRSYAVIEDSALNHAASAPCNDAAGCGADDGLAGSSCSPEKGLPTI
ncbi:hypothetical protein T492DRAFT_832232 [Pavlovales sp. CCMP2436]|nr:hypothetical protein T492DRAFT_832232 [Pavlovales sp. CCMP2436]